MRGELGQVVGSLVAWGQRAVGEVLRRHVEGTKEAWRESCSWKGKARSTARWGLHVDLVRPPWEQLS